MTHEEFMNALLRPIFVWRMARGVLGASPTFGDGKQNGAALSAPGRMTNAERDIDAIVIKRAETLGMVRREEVPRS